MRDPAWTAAVVLDALLQDDVADEELEFTSFETAELNDGIARLGNEAGAGLVGLRGAILRSLREAEDRLRER